MNIVQVRREKEYELAEGTSEHQGHQCARCGARPILGTRWQCRNCPQVSVLIKEICCLVRKQVCLAGLGFWANSCVES